VAAAQKEVAAASTGSDTSRSPGQPKPAGGRAPGGSALAANAPAANASGGLGVGTNGPAGGRTAGNLQLGNAPVGNGTAGTAGAGQPLTGSSPAPDPVGQAVQAQKQLDDLKLPIGWAGASAPNNLWLALLGWLITAFALTLGAPFWFDLLKRFVNIRSAGQAPEEKAAGSAKK